MAKTVNTAVQRARKKARKNVTDGTVCVYASFNSTIITITNYQSNVLSRATSGGQGFKGSRKSTPFIAQVAVEGVGRTTQDQGIKNLEVHTGGPGPGRKSAAHVLNNLGIRTRLIEDVTPVPHNGYRPPKHRRI